MAKMSVAVTSGGRMSSELDAYVGRLEHAGEELMEALAEETAIKAIEYAPAGHKPDKRTPALKDAIRYEFGKGYARIIVTARHALIIEYGGGPSKIPGSVSFYWDKEGRRWHPGPNIIEHPPTRSQPYMRPALDDIMREWHSIARRIYPN